MQRTIRLIQEGIEKRLHIGAQIYVSRDGKVVIDEAMGLARPEREGRGVPMARETLMLWLSASKPMAAIAVAQLWERGLLDLDDAVTKHMPEFAAQGKEEITLRHILTHTAPLRLVDIGWPNATWQEMIARICAMRPEPRWISGRTAGYSPHVTWFILAEIVRRLSKQSFEEYAHEKIFRPCGMDDCHFAMTREAYGACGDRMGELVITEKSEFPTMQGDGIDAAPFVRPSASGRGPARQLAKLYEALLNHGEPILKPQTVEAMTARHRANMHDKTFGAIIDWGLGFIINSNGYGNENTPYQYGPHASARAFGHSGNQSSIAFADPEHRLAVAVIFNGMPEEAAHQGRVHAVLAAIYEDLGLV